MSATNIDAQLELFPESVIEFLLPIDQPSEIGTTPGKQQQDNASPKATMTLKHPDSTSPPIAFKVKTTQPRRYLVRPNQGLIMPGQQETIQILLVEKDKSMLVENYQKLGTVAFDHTKDKFLVQSVAILEKNQLSKLADYEQLSSMWSSVSSSTPSPGMSAVSNKKLSVKFTVFDPSSSAIPSPSSSADRTSNTALPILPTSSSTSSAINSTTDIAKLSSDQMMIELNGLRRKYDELVSFSVNLTAERDILNNTLEQTKRDLNRQIAKAAANDNSANTTTATNNTSNPNTPTSEKNRRGASGPPSNGKRLSTSGTNEKTSTTAGFTVLGLLTQILLYIAIFIVGAHLQQSGLIEHHAPFISSTVLPTLSYIIPSPQTQIPAPDTTLESVDQHKTTNSHRTDEL